MSFETQLDLLHSRLDQSTQCAGAWMERFRAEADFARHFASLFPNQTSRWQSLILKAAEHVADAAAGGAVDMEKTVSEAEKIMEPIGKAAKGYTIHCVGHAHIDMNWVWPWLETVTVSNDTFSTVDTLMDEFPEFHYSQSQASTYIAMEEYVPETFEMIKRRIKEGRWEATASMWVEGDKNIVSGESLCRHLLYTRKYMKEHLGLNPEDVKIDWSPDTFGHTWTLPSVLARGGVSRYYFCRTGPGPWLFRWRSPDCSEVLAFNDRAGYNGRIHPQMAHHMCGFVSQTGLKDFLYTYGVGDHGGGPTRRDLRKAREMAAWPIFPVIKLDSVDGFFTAVEKAKSKLPVIDCDLNFTFEGCYTSQSRIKRANRISEIILPEAETIAVIARAIDKMDYPYDILLKGWRYTLFSHFHDILPGSGIHRTYDYSEGLFQEIEAISGSIRTRALRKLAGLVNTADAAKCETSTLGSGLGDGLGAGAGDPGTRGGVTARNAGALCAEPVLLFNPKPWKRSGIACAKVWNKELDDDRVLVRDSAGNEQCGQVIARGRYWGHHFTTVGFKAEDVPALGYKVYAIDSSPVPVPTEGARIDRFLADGTETMIPEVKEGGVLENEYLKVTVDFASGAIKSLVDKETGFDYVPKGKLLGVLEAYQEAPHSMSAWIIGQITEMYTLDSGGRCHVTQRGPHRVAINTDHTYRDSRISVEIGLDAGAKMVDFALSARWVERGSHETGIPMLRAAFPVNVENGVPTYEIPFGSQSRAQSLQEIPALKWADISRDAGKTKHGITLVNDCKYGHSCHDNVLRLTLIRSSYDPDPLPEVTDHHIRFAVIPHKGALDVVAATRAGEEFNSPMSVVSATVHEGKLPGENSFAEVLTPNVFVSAIKQAEDSKAIVVRLFETEGKKTTAKIRLSGLVKKGAKAVETDILERPLRKNSARFAGEVLTVTVPALSQATVKVG